ncbi:hypothetical protein [Rubritalea tangerina]|uniref:hypothetical protein n=1 Tax=Rubritalea tangerina TaxID=430798 RepID=UPI00360FE5C9
MCEWTFVEALRCRVVGGWGIWQKHPLKSNSIFDGIFYLMSMRLVMWFLVHYHVL